MRQCIGKALAPAALGLALLLGEAGSLGAQTAGGDEAALRQEQARLFREMFEDPDDLDKMFAYALTSIRLQDYEAAISTLDRILIFNPDLPRVKLELGAAYYRIGSYTIAEFYFDEVRNDPSTPPDLLPRIDAFLEEIDERTATSSFSGVVSANLIGTTNANNGPDSPTIDFMGTPVDLADPEATSQSDVGASFSLALTHVQDLGGADGDAWRSNFAYYSARFADTEAGSADVAIFRTGPELSLDDDRYGPKIRPFFEADLVRSAEDALYWTVGAGAEYTDTLDDENTIRADIRVGYRDFADGAGVARELDRMTTRASFGLLRFLDEDTALRAIIGAEIDVAGDDEESSAEISLTGGLNHFYDSGFDFAGRLWLIAATAQAAYREHFGFDDIPQVRRKDFDLRLELSHTAFLKDGLALNLKADYFLRESNSRNFDLDSLSLSGGVSYYF